MKDFTFIFWHLENPNRKITGYPCMGYPQADKMVPAFERVGANFQTIELFKYVRIHLGEKQAKQEKPFKKIGTILQSNKVLLEWDGIFYARDYRNIWKWKKKLYIIPHDEEKVGRSWYNLEQQNQLRREIIGRSVKFISELPSLKECWKPFDRRERIEIIYPPTRQGKTFDKMESRKKLGIKTKYAIICWGNWGVKKYHEMIPWIAEWKDTSLLFCGSGTSVIRWLIEKGSNDLGILDKIFFSQQSISDEDSDLWFSASDLCTFPEDRKMGTSTPTHVVGQGKCFIALRFSGYQDLEKVSGVVTTSDLKSTTRELLLNEDKRRIQELKSIEYAQKNSYEDYAIKIGKLMGYSYREKQ